MTLKQAYEYGQEQLKNAEIDDAALDAWYLLEYVTGVSRAMYFLDMNREISLEQETKYCSYVATRAKHVPLQHITGVQEFMGLEFLVNEHVLVPRQDTEVLVECVLEDLKSGIHILDMCTGSGCILLSLLKLCRMSNVNGVGVDISEEALKVAKQNAEKLEVNARFISSDLFCDVEGKYDVIVSNPPYIRTSVIEELKEEVKFHDPFIALDGKEDGLYFYRRIVEDSPKYLKKGGKLYFEIGHDQGEDVSKLMKDAGFVDVTVKKDLAGLDRVVFGMYSVIRANS
ncbi:MAG: peptide chain release factor N(5)-glutamine methyltransferase [Tyzzerella sp.]|nr:peptide chain release factor N(5)-glutamine methyltransferase [Tyzzerella sp.]